MSSASMGRGLLLTALAISAGCSDLGLRRSTESALLDTVPAPASSPARSTRPRTQKIRRTRGGNEEAGFAEVRRTLRRLVVAEETFFAENGTYTDELSLIGLSPDANITIRFLWLSPNGWAVSGRHNAVPGKDCVIFVGRAHAPPRTLKYVRPGREAIPVCDDSSASQPAAPPASQPQPTQPRTTPVDTGSSLDLLDPRVLMKVDLRNLAHSQETYFATQGIYSRRTEPLGLQYLWHRDVKVKILAADAQSWMAKATHAKFPGKSCVIWFGTVPQRPVTDAQQRRETRAGVPVCDD